MKKKPNADVVICKSSLTFNSIEHYYNEGLVPKYMNEFNKFEGLSNFYLVVEDNKITCGFTRDNYNSNPKYINITEINKLYLISGYGSLKGEGTLIKSLKNL